MNSFIYLKGYVNRKFKFPYLVVIYGLRICVYNYLIYIFSKIRGFIKIRNTFREICFRVGIAIVVAEDS